jgi:hypothetical protein
MKKPVSFFPPIPQQEGFEDETVMARFDVSIVFENAQNLLSGVLDASFPEIVSLLKYHQGLASETTRHGDLGQQFQGQWKKLRP